MAAPDEQTSAAAEKIRAGLEALGAKNRHPSASSHTAPQAAGRWRHFALWALAALGFNAAVVAVLHYSLANPPVPATPAMPPTAETPMEIVDYPAPSPAINAPDVHQFQPTQPVAPKPTKVGTITVNGQTHTFPLTPALAQYQTYNTYPSPPVVVRQPRTSTNTYRPPVVVQPAPATSGATTSAPAEPNAAAHAAVAKEYAYQHFRYSYKVGSQNYEVTSLNITTTGTTEVTGWGTRHRTTGTAGLSYYANDGFKRTTRKFEVLTEVQNGQVTANEIDVKY
ncbi:MAG: hypothetical protein ABII82_19660 [Verrucomicrobiota bacterium]